MPITTFSIDGNNILCPDSFEPDLASSLKPYQDGSPMYWGRTMLKLTWKFLPDNYVALIRQSFYNLVHSFDPSSSFGTPISVTIPDYLNGNFRMVSCYLSEPTGTGAGDGTRNFSTTLYCLHETSFQSALANSEGDLWYTLTNGGGVVFGASQYTGTGMQF
jgi:hypothetical protein